MKNLKITTKINCQTDQYKISDKELEKTTDESKNNYEYVNIIKDRDY